MGREACLERAAAFLVGNVEDAELALALAGAMAAADGELAEAERAALASASEVLGIGAKRRTALIGG